MICDKCLHPVQYYSKSHAFGSGKVHLRKNYYCTLCKHMIHVDKYINVWDLWMEDE